ncbi:hypothetical protein ABVK25_006817 [Lepraria finkii]|uniref:Uncharacterized protein n=1 Tax=Lepraria finkii TaxID=1340010 RepID=A0ABR4B6B6_9LECA
MGTLSLCGRFAKGVGISRQKTTITGLPYSVQLAMDYKGTTPLDLAINHEKKDAQAVPRELGAKTSAELPRGRPSDGQDSRSRRIATHRVKALLPEGLGNCIYSGPSNAPKILGIRSARERLAAQDCNNTYVKGELR